MHEIFSHKGPVLIHFNYEPKGLDAALKQRELADNSADKFCSILQGILLKPPLIKQEKRNLTFLSENLYDFP